MNRQKKILFSFILSLPVILFVAQNYLVHSPELKPSGITMDENVLYMSYAHQYLDQDKFSLFYSNPFDGDPHSPKIYFQPVNFLFAGCMKLGMDPGLCFSLFGLIMVVCCIYLGICILQHLLPEQKKITLITTLFTWGGGLTAFAGLMATSFLSGHHTPNWFAGIYLADPANGWWGLNWGRTLFIPLEAYYHFIFLLNIYFILKQKWRAAIITAFFLSISHPFTGIEFLLIINGWLMIEKFFYHNKNVPYWFWAAILVITAFHGWYYLIYLNSFPEHKQLFTQYSTGWTYSLWIAIPAYCIVAALALLKVYINKPLKKNLSIPHQRLFLCWAIIAFLLSKHEWFIRPIQPVHFTRGYIWAGLFLFALPALIWIIDYLQKSSWRRWLLYLFLFVFLSDNILWTTNLLRGKNDIEWEGHISNDTRTAIEFIKRKSSVNTLLLGNASIINYIANVYTHANSWVSHPYNTPDREARILQMKNFLQTGQKPKAWINREIFIVIDKRTDTLNILPSLKSNKLFENSFYIIFTP